jgi:uncharacterized membrane protein
MLSFGLWAMGIAVVFLIVGIVGLYVTRPKPRRKA